MPSLRLPKLPGTAAAAALLSSTLFAQMLATGDQRQVREPHYAQPCIFLRAQFSTAQRSSPPATDDSARLQDGLTRCAGSGRSVVLLPSSAANAFYSGTLTVNGEALVVAGGVTLFGNNYGSSQFIYVTGNTRPSWGRARLTGATT
ncbi:MAG TPA: hypothetical protein VME18_08725 [Acidobacteriaceae bacterium]|nr:hypothetical protein [Acidobacteriaceae bacterium]